MITVTVPATSANCGSGFDTLGIALSLSASFHFETSDKLRIEGCDQAYANENNLVIQSFNQVYEKAKKTAPNLHLIIDSEIPLARGLGSSAACIVAGVLAANHLLGSQFSLEECFQLASSIEGHPDNIAPCLFGGFTASTRANGQWITAPLNVDESLHFYACIPDFELSTKKSREVLPEQVSYAQATGNLSKLAFLIKGMETGNQEYLTIGFNDQLHQPYRFPLIDESQNILDWCRDNRYPVYLSGAGPTMMIVTKEKIDFSSITKKLSHQWKIVLLSVDQKGAKIYE